MWLATSFQLLSIWYGFAIDHLSVLYTVSKENKRIILSLVWKDDSWPFMHFSQYLSKKRRYQKCKIKILELLLKPLVSCWSQLKQKSPWYSLTYLQFVSWKRLSRWILYRNSFWIKTATTPNPQKNNNKQNRKKPPKTPPPPNPPPNILVFKCRFNLGGFVYCWLANSLSTS